MRYINEYNDFVSENPFTGDNWEYEEYPGNYLSFSDILKYKHISVNEEDYIDFLNILNDNGYVWVSRTPLIRNNTPSHYFHRLIGSQDKTLLVDIGTYQPLKIISVSMSNNIGKYVPFKYIK